MIVVGLTGSIASGKTTLVKMLRYRHIAVFDADAVVHQLLSSSVVMAEIQNVFPNVKTRSDLRQIAFESMDHLLQLEQILHPKVSAACQNFIRQKQRQNCRLVVLDIPLLFESGLNALCDYVWVTLVPDYLQKIRLQQRGLYQAQQIELILQRQWPQSLKQHCADLVLPSGLGKSIMARHLTAALTELQSYA